MFVTRLFGRTLCTAAKTEASTSAAAAASATVKTARNPLEEFFEVDRSGDEEKPIVYGTTCMLFFF